MFINRKNMVYKFCSESTDTALDLYCECINKSTAEIFIVMAQKAICLFELLLYKGRICPELKNKYVSSSSLDFDFSYLIGKRIAIVDDIIISGSAIATVANKLLKNGVSESDLEIIALVRNIEYQTMQFTKLSDEKNLLHCALSSKDAECIEISYDISHILAYNGRPYDADFPVYHRIEMGDRIFTNNFPYFDWDIYDITNDMHHQGDITALVLFPKENIMNQIEKMLGFNIRELIHLKVRVYVHDYASGHSRFDIVPMALFNEVTEENINLIFKHIANREILKISENWSFNAKMRYLQFYIAHVLQQLLVDSLSISSCQFDKENARASFGEASFDSIIKSLQEIKVCSGFIEIRPNHITIDNLGYDKYYKKDELIKSDEDKGYTINKILYEPFLWWYTEKELTTRNNIKNHARHFINDYELIRCYMKRLKEGFSFSALKNMLASIKDIYQLEYLISLFIDRSVDEGIIVPIIYHNESEHYICRAYRHGEDLPFGEADKSRILYFLQCLDHCFRSQNGNVEETIATVSFEKMIVLFYQLGLKNGCIFNRFLGFDNDPILQQRFNIHGIVATVRASSKENNTHIYLSSESNNDSYMTYMVTRLLSEEPSSFLELIDIDGRKNYKIKMNEINAFFKNNELNNICQEIADDIKKIAILIGTWYCIEAKWYGKNMFKDRISALTSCTDIYTFASSIATANHYFKQYWEREAREALLDLRQGNEVEDFSSSRFGQALPSARKKHKWYQSDYAIDVINHVERLFFDHRLNDKCETWNCFWRRDRNTRLEGRQELKDFTNKSVCYMYFFSECYEWLCQKYIISTRKKEDNWKYYTNFKDSSSIEEAKKFYKIFERAMSNKEISKRIDSFIQSIDNIIALSEKTIQDIESCLSEKATTYTTTYSSVLLLDIKVSETKVTNDFFRYIWSMLPENKDKTKMNIIQLETFEEDYQRYGIFHENSDICANRSLLEIYKHIHYQSCVNAFVTRALFIPVLPDGLSFRHNTRDNISKYAHTFSESLHNLMLQIHFTNNIHQFLLLRTWDTTDEGIKLVETYLDKYIKIQQNDAITFSPIFPDFEYNHFVCGTGVSTVDKLVYSTVKIEVDEKIVGTGVLIQYLGKIYCITCQHILDNNSDGCITATTASNKCVISLNPINYTSKEMRIAKEEVLILEPALGEYPDFDNNCFFCTNDFIVSYDCDDMDKYCLFGFGGDDNKHGHKELNISNDGYVANDFLQTKSDGIHIGPGDSGAAIVNSINQKLLGIHAMSKEDKSPKYALIIPAKIVLEVLQENIN